MRTRVHTHTHTHTAVLCCAPCWFNTFQSEILLPPTQAVWTHPGLRGWSGSYDCRGGGGRGDICTHTHTHTHSCMHAHMLAGLLSGATWTSGSMSWAGLEHAWAYKGLFVPVWLPGVPAEHSAMVEVTSNSQWGKLYLMSANVCSPVITARWCHSNRRARCVPPYVLKTDITSHH